MENSAEVMLGMFVVVVGCLLMVLVLTTVGEWIDKRRRHK